jgi:hypothetical protein
MVFFKFVQQPDAHARWHLHAQRGNDFTNDIGAGRHVDFDNSQIGDLAGLDAELIGRGN